MNIRQTSLSAYTAIQLDQTMNRQEKIVYQVLKQYPTGLTRNEISQNAGIRINAVCGRVNAMLKRGLVKEEGKKYDNHSRKLNYIVTING